MEVVQDYLERPAPVRGEPQRSPEEGPVKFVVEQRQEARGDVNHRRLREALQNARNVFDSPYSNSCSIVPSSSAGACRKITFSGCNI